MLKYISSTNNKKIELLDVPSTGGENAPSEHLGQPSNNSIPDANLLNNVEKSHNNH